MPRNHFPVGMEAIKEYYGDPTPFTLLDGSIDPDWERRLDYVYLPYPLPLGWNPDIKVMRIRIHQRLRNSLSNVFEGLSRYGYWHMLESFDGTYSWRCKRTSQKLSLHCWGAAIDLNAGSNPLGGLGTMPWQVINMFRQEGWQWGGDWTYADPMHFQAASGY